MFFPLYLICKKNRMKKILINIWLMALTVAIYSCQSPADKLTPEQKSVQNQIDTIQLRAEAVARAIGTMTQDSLLLRLHEDSRSGREPFNSPAYRELIKRKDIDIDKLLNSVNTYDRGSILNLLALRTLNRQKYQQVADSQKIAILADALAQSKTFNMWGLPNLKMEAAAHAFIECGEKAVASLKPLLSDCRPATIWGDEEYQIYKQFRLRLCDYALTLIKRIREKEFNFPAAPEERDRLIQILKQEK
jgi:hypothetical protein